MLKKVLYILLTCMLPLFPMSCEREGFATDDGGVQLSFSADTVAFDTVFTTMGTATQKVTVYNRSGDNLIQVR